MKTSHSATEGLKWNKIGRRWIAALGVMLVVNGLMVVLAICDYGGRASSGQLNAATAKATETSDKTTSSNSDQPPSAGQPVQVGEASEIPGTDASSPAIQATVQPIAISPHKPDEKVSSEIQPTSVAQNADREVTEGTPAVAVQPTAATAKIRTIVQPEIKPTDLNQALPNSKAEAAHDELEASLIGMVVIVNPPTTGGIVHCVVDGNKISLLPGEYQQLAASGKQSVTFHRGDDLGDVELPLSAGVFAFSVSETGWDLAPTSGEPCRRLLRTCRLFE